MAGGSCTETAKLVRELREAYLGCDTRFCSHGPLLTRAAAALDGIPGPNGKAWEKVWISQDVIMHLQGIEAQAGNLSDAINLFKRFESEARTDATGDRQE